jgi:microsomal dipeptidase-like Zn-dependent dipeptidase
MVASRLVGAIAVGAAAALGSRLVGRTLVARAERRHCPTTNAPPFTASQRARELHRELRVVDLHADSLLWGRDLLRRGDQGQVDVPRLIEGNVALQVLAASTKVPRNANLERNDDRSDDVTLLGIAAGWPPATWRSLLARALYLASRADALARQSDGTFEVIRSRADLAVYLERRRATPAIAAGMLAIEGAHALDGDPANVEVVADAGFRMMSPSHLFDTAFGGSAHGVAKGGLTRPGHEMVERMEARGMIVDLAHASTATIDDVLAIARRPVVCSHTGVRGTCDSARNLSDDHLRGIAATGGLIGIGFWPSATCGDAVMPVARAIRHATNLAGIGHVGLGSDFDGAVAQPIDASGMVQITDALLVEGFDEDQVAAIMGGNALRVLATSLPDDATSSARLSDGPRP